MPKQRFTVLERSRTAQEDGIILLMEMWDNVKTIVGWEVPGFRTFSCAFNF